MQQTSRPKLIAVVGQQRGGTTGLRSFLATNAKAVDLGEIFSGYVGIADNFWGYIKSIDGHPEYPCPHFWYNAWENYIIEKSIKHSVPNLIFDLKADHLPYLYMDNPFSNNEESFFALSWLDLKIIYIERKNYLAMYVSRLLAEITGQWALISSLANTEEIKKFLRTVESNGLLVDNNQIQHVLEDPILAGQGKISIIVDPQEAFKAIKLIKNGYHYCQKKIAGMDHHKIFYEDIFEDEGNINENCATGISSYLEIDRNILSKYSITAKQSKSDFLHIVQNKDQLIDFFRGTEYFYMIPEKYI